MNTQELLAYEQVRHWAGRQEAAGTLGHAHSRTLNGFAVYLNAVDPEYDHAVSYEHVYRWHLAGATQAELACGTPTWICGVLHAIDHSKTFLESVSGAQFFSFVDEAKPKAQV